MLKGLLTNTFAAVSAAYHHASLSVYRFLHDTDFLNIGAQETGHKLSQIFETAVRSIQKSAQRFLTFKGASGDFAPRPLGNVLSGFAMEAQIIARAHLLPILSKNITNPAFVASTATALMLCFLLNEGNIAMITDQLNQYAALWNNKPSDIDSRLCLNDEPCPNKLA